MRRRGVTLKDVALQAGVSDATVSAVLSASRSNNVRVSEATRQVVVEVARRLRYQPNATARSLRRQHTNIIGFYGGPSFQLSASHPVSAAMLGGMQMGCADAGKNLLLYGSFHQMTEDRIFIELANGHVDGLIVWTAQNDPVVRQLSEFGVPMVAMVDSIPTIPSVASDDIAGARSVVEYLAKKGHERLAFCSDGSSSTSIVARRLAFEDATREFGLSFWDCPPIPYDRDRGAYNVPGAEFDWLKLPRDERATAVAGAFDEISSFFVANCLEAHFRMPEDLAIVGFDGTVPLGFGAPSLTTIRCPWQAVGRMAVKLLSDLLRGVEIPMETVLPVELVVGATA